MNPPQKDTINATFIYTKQPALPAVFSYNHWCIVIECNIGYVNDVEKYIVGTKCGTIPYSQQRVDEYEQYRRHFVTIDQVMMKSFNITKNILEIDAMYKYYYNLKMKDWYGDDLIDM